MFELKPCPFCGGTLTAVFCFHRDFYVACYRCNTCGPTKDTNEKAVEAWNSRVGDDQMERMVEDGK